MNYTFLVVIAACLIGCGAQPYTQQELNSYCEECMRESEKGPVRAHPFRCDAFINCQPVYKSFIGHEQPCPVGLFFDDDVLTCRPNHACSKPCKNGDKYKNFAYCDTYFKCENSKFDTSAVYTSCSSPLKFDETQQQCTANGKCFNGCPHLNPGSTKSQYIQTHLSGKTTTLHCPKGLEFEKFQCKCSKPEVCTDYYALSNIVGNFKQLSHSRWVEMPCPPNLAFNLTTCTCSNVIKDQIGKKCLRVHLPLEKDTSDIYLSYVEDKKVAVKSRSGKFNGDAYLILPVTANNDFRNGIEVSLSFSLSNSQTGDKVALIGNARCNDPGTFAMYIKDAQSNSPKVVVDMVIGRSHTKNTLQADVAFNTWQTVKVQKTQNRAILYVNGVKVKDVIASGPVVRSPCSYGVGKMLRMSNFKGLMKNIYIAKCVT